MNLTERTGKTRQPQRQGTERPDRHGVTTGELKTVTNMETTLTHTGDADYKSQRATAVFVTYRQTLQPLSIQKTSVHQFLHI